MISAARGRSSSWRPLTESSLLKKRKPRSSTALEQDHAGVGCAGLVGGRQGHRLRQRHLALGDGRARLRNWAIGSRSRSSASGAVGRPWRVRRGRVAVSARRGGAEHPIAASACPAPVPALHLGWRRSASSKPHTPSRSRRRSSASSRSPPTSTALTSGPLGGLRRGPRAQRRRPRDLVEMENDAVVKKSKTILSYAYDGPEAHLLGAGEGRHQVADGDWELSAIDAGRTQADLLAGDPTRAGCSACCCAARSRARSRSS